MRAVVVRPDRVVVVGPDGRVDDTTWPRQTATRIQLGGSRGSWTVELPHAAELDVRLDADGFVALRPEEPVADDPMWTDYAFVAMLDPVELADASPSLEHPVVPGVARPPAVEVHRLDADLRGGRETWWAEVSPRVGYDPRCSCCPLLWGRASEDLEAVSGGATMPSPPVSGTYPERHLVGLDLQTGVCVHVEHLDGDVAGRGFSLDVLAVDDEVVLPAR